MVVGVDAGVPGVDSWTGTAAAALARDLAWAAGPRWKGRQAAPDAGAPHLKEEALAVRR